jgi:hypothetical protein
VAGPADLAIPRALHERVDPILDVTDAFCTAHLDAGYARICRKMVARLARKRPSPLLRGDPRVWAAGVIHAAGHVNFLFDPSEPLHLTVDELSRLIGVSRSTLTNKSRAIGDLLRIDLVDPEYCRVELLAAHPYAWLVEVDGLLLDARHMPRDVQDELHRRGVIPDPEILRPDPDDAPSTEGRA